MATPQNIALMNKDYSNKLFNTKVSYNKSKCFIEMPGYLEDALYRNLFSKAIQHPNGQTPDVQTYQKLIQAIKNKDVNLLYSIVNQNTKLVDPYCILDSELLGMYRSSVVVSDTPAPTSEQAGAELLEVYAMALLRDIPFSEWTGDPLVAEIISDLNLVKTALGAPLENGNITVSTLFRGPAVSGNLIGPYVSQFLYHDFILGSLVLKQKHSIAPTTEDFLTNITTFVNNWNSPIDPVNLIGPNERYMIDIRDCANSHHLDQLWQVFFIAATILLNRNVPFSVTSARQAKTFIHLGPVDLFDLMMTAAKLSMNATWMIKWSQLRYRPEEMAYQVHLKKSSGNGLNFPSSLLTNPILDKINEKYGNYLMPVAFPEGSPSHPSYPSGHATVAGAMATVVKAFFDCNQTIPGKIPNADGSELIDLTSNGEIVQLNIGNELNKLAYNCGIFRNFGGIHYRADYNGVLVGEQVAIDVLTEFVTRYEKNVTFTLKKMDGATILISNQKS